MHQSLHTHPLHNDIILKLLNTVRGTEVERDEEEEEWEEEAEGSRTHNPGMRLRIHRLRNST